MKHNERPEWMKIMASSVIFKRKVKDAQRTLDMRQSRTAQYIIGTNRLTKFHEDRKINVASVLTRKNAPPPGSHVFQPTGIFFKLVQDIIGMNLLNKFHKDRTVNVASREKCPAPWKPFFTNLLTKFHEDWTIIVASRVLTRPYKEKCPAPGGHVFTATKTIFELIQDIIGPNLLTKFHDDRKTNVTSRVLTSHRGGHVFQPTGIIFELVQDSIGINLLTEFHEDRTINLASRVLTRFYYSLI
ncbi:hypothetical protein DPMN_161754 [Dreissena polymorpha]|uniref:Uncharacterized protein n=1 Tax=Dreissena polymorpha TaxID=45954 RepID=A0A9D4EN90_DREPO|nr:hypothetical protein DPMN_161754 [Dreissena polymorpha]